MQVARLSRARLGVHHSFSRNSIDLSSRRSASSTTANPTVPDSPRLAFEPLRVLFCGADEFSIYSLRALNRLRLSRPDAIESLEVICRPDKRIGRGLKNVQAVPIKSVATDELGLTLHQIDTFTGWSPPSPVHLIVAVSFGLLVPSRLLHAAKYGGLNVHPSLLPDLRGPAPLQHALLQRRSYTGLTLQTMHPKRLDHGVILAQSPPPGIPIPPSCVPNQLLHRLGPLGAEMLVDGIQRGLFMRPIDQLPFNKANFDTTCPTNVSHAPKILPSDRNVDWHNWTAEDLLLRDRVLGRLWDTTTYSQCMPDAAAPKRISFQGPWEIVSSEFGFNSPQPGRCYPIDRGQGVKGVAICLADARGVAIPTEVTIDGDPKNTGMGKLHRGLMAKLSASRSG